MFGGSDGDSDPAPAPAPAPTASSTETPALPPDAPPPLIGGTPKEDELTEKFGLFVSLIGTPDGEGTRAKPLSSISAAIEKAKASAKRVYVCKGTYNEAVVIANAVSVIGGFDCATKWVATDARSKIVSPTIPALRASDILNDTSFANFDVVAPNATVESPSSIGFVAQNAKLLKVVKSSISSGNGMSGEPGVEPTPIALPASATGVDGAAGTDKNGGEFIVIFPNIPMDFSVPGAKGGTGTCGGVTLDPGGVGGDGGRYQCKKFTTTQGGSTIELFRWKTYIGIVPTNGPAKANGGASGSVGLDGASATSIGQLGAGGYVPADGTPGQNGGPGTGGKGGNGESNFDGATCKPDKEAYYASGATGPGGGAGGCPGVAGTAGKGGAASIAVLMLKSEGLTFDAAELHAGSGGAGGKGTLGAEPSAGGQPGAAKPGAIAGVAGGAGGRPGVSGSGAGGPSIGIAHSGGAPALINGAVAKAGKGGDGVPADSKTAVGVTWTLPASVPGVAEDVHAF
ncbi:PE-PGRS virulence associated protein [Labilithrix luteola]|uniref:PE-PGRS virulence associated protein n=1 Tax=Labilithrix luteola TaxID=1391654 RepID=A0A0K1Q0H8_9BACT|nr:PE-PGRS virulence associated protein [Labilithrix luteola]